MPVTSSVARDDYVGDGTLADYDFTFPILDVDDLHVSTVDADGALTDLARGADYTVALSAYTRTGSIHLTGGNLASGVRLAIVDDQDLTQLVAFETSNKYPPAIVGRAFDRVTMQLRTLKEEVRHAWRFPLAENVDGTFADKIARAWKIPGFDVSGNLELIDRSEFGDGTSVPATGGGIGYTVTDEAFGAFGDGLSHPVSADEAAQINADFAAVGAQGAFEIQAGDERDYAAHQCMLWKSAVTGQPCYTGPGTFRINRPLILQWTATPIAGQPSTPLMARWSGAGPSTIIKGYDIPAGRAVVEFLGESNGHAVNCEVSHMVIEEDASCHKYSFCLRMGDSYCGIHLYRVICKGAQALALRVGSSFSYADICFLATQCQFWSNWENRWGSDAALDVYSLVPESLGSYWDSALFQACFFWGQVDVRAFTLKFDLCMFICPPMRNTPYGCTAYLGTACWDTCYFEDHLVGIATDGITPGVPITNVTIRNCHFSSNNNLTPPTVAQSSIQCARDSAQHGPVRIENCRFGGTASYSDIDLYGPITVDVVGCCRAFGAINTGPTITRAGDVRLTVRNPNGELSFDVMLFEKVRIQCPTQIGPVVTVEAADVAAENTDENSTVGATSYAARVVKVGATVIKMIAYSPTHGAVPGYALINADSAVFALAFNGAPRLYISDEPSYDNWAKLGGLCYAQTADKTIANSAAITSIYTSGIGSVVIPANFPRAGRKVVVEGGGLLSTTGTPTLDFYLNFDAVAICSILAMAASGLTNAGFYFRVEITFRTIGATAAVIATGYFVLNGVSHAIAMAATVAVNTTGPIVVDPDLKWSAADPANTLKVTAYSVRAE